MLGRMPLGICENCKRHARCGDACPFCGADSIAYAPAPSTSAIRVAAIVVAGLQVTCTSHYGNAPPPPAEWSDYGDPTVQDASRDAAKAAVHGASVKAPAPSDQKPE
jgi:hypothetical protein